MLLMKMGFLSAFLFVGYWILLSAFASFSPNELSVQALRLAASVNPTDHHELQSYLEDAEFLNRLDSELDYIKRKRTDLRIGRVIDALARNEVNSAQQVLTNLTESNIFLAHDRRVELLIDASVHVRPTPPQMVRFWQKCLNPIHGYPTLTVDAMVKNGSPSAMEQLERTMADPAYEDADKIGWMRRSFLKHRNDLPLLQSCRRMFSGVLPEPLRPFLVEVLFDYRPGEWFRPSWSAPRPSRAKMTTEARQELHAIGRLALESIELTKTQQFAIERTLAGLRNGDKIEE
jgi:hypothetical protein